MEKRRLGSRGSCRQQGEDERILAGNVVGENAENTVVSKVGRGGVHLVSQRCRVYFGYACFGFGSGSSSGLAKSTHRLKTLYLI